MALSTQHRASRRFPAVAIAMGVWLLMGATDVLQALARHHASGTSYDLLEVVVGPLPAYIMLALFTPAVFALSAKCSVVSAPRAGAIVILLAASLLFPILHLAVSAGLTEVTFRALGRRNVNSLRLFDQWIGVYYASDVLRFWALIGVYSAVDSHRRATRSELELQEARRQSADLRAAASETKLEVLGSQLGPHFLFNSLNTIGGLAAEGEGQRAHEVVTDLARMLRTLLSRTGPTVPLEEELALVRSYVAVEQARIGDRLSIVITASPDTLSQAVPVLLLQLLAENAIRHGVAKVPGPGSISIRASREGDSLVLEVRDTGVGFRHAADSAGSGTALRNIRNRLEHLYGRLAEFETKDEGGAVVIVRLPWRPVTAN
jgi:signal transduction histidine kinase